MPGETRDKGNQSITLKLLYSSTLTRSDKTEEAEVENLTGDEGGREGMVVKWRMGNKERQQKLEKENQKAKKQWSELKQLCSMGKREG